MLTPAQRQARRDLYNLLDPNRIYQKAGYDYLVDETDAVFEQIPSARDFFPAHQERGHAMANVDGLNYKPWKIGEAQNPACDAIGPEGCATAVSQLGQLRISAGERVCRDAKLAVVVIALGAPPSLAKAVSSLIQQDTPAEIVVVNSGGGKARQVLEENLQSIILVEVAEPIYVGAARNIGIQMSHAPFVAFLACDCTAEADWIAKRVQTHLNGNCAVASIVVNDKLRNPFAWAAHLMTYGHRMGGKTGPNTAAYGASYDRALFDKYGYFSEALRIGEDSEFHSRFRPSDQIRLITAIRTVHKNPDGPFTFLKDQIQRGLRARYTADFLRAEFTFGYIALAAGLRIVRSFRLSITNLKGRERWAAIASWPLIPIGTVFYLWGMLRSYFTAAAAERLFRQGSEFASLGQPDAAITAIERAACLRPGTARYHLTISSLWNLIGKPDFSARELYYGWDLDRSGPELYSGRSAAAMDSTPSGRLGAGMTIVAFAGASAMQVAEFLSAIKGQRFITGFDVIIVETGGKNGAKVMREIRRTYKDFAKFLSAKDLSDYFSSNGAGCISERPSFVATTSCSCLPPPEWLQTLAAYIEAYPEIELFQGSCRPLKIEDGGGLLERMCHDLGFYPRGARHEGLLCFDHASNWACSSSLLWSSGGFANEGGEPLGFWTLTDRILKAGASSLNAADWQTQFNLDATLARLLRRFYQEGGYAAKHVTATKDQDIAALFSPPGWWGAIASTWRFTIANFRVWRFANRYLILYAPVFLLLLSVGIARQLGWSAGMRRYGRSLRGAVFDE